MVKIKNRGVLIESSDSEVGKLASCEQLEVLNLEGRVPNSNLPKLIVYIYNVSNELTEEDVCDQINQGLPVSHRDEGIKSAFKHRANEQDTANRVLGRVAQSFY
jgi:hypothetical protein